MVSVAAGGFVDLQAYVAGFVVCAAGASLAGWQLWRIVRLRVFGRTTVAVRNGTGWLEFEVPGRGSRVCTRSVYGRRTDRRGKLQVVYDPRNPRLCVSRDEIPGCLTFMVVVAFLAAMAYGAGLMIAGMAG